MALTAAEEALVRELIAENPELLSLAANEATIISKLGATKKNLSELAAALSLNDTDLAFVRQGTSDKSVAVSVLKAYAQSGIDLSLYLPKAGGSMTGLLKFAAGSNIASSGTVNLTTATGNTVHITGTTGISAWTMTAGQIMNVIFDGVLTLTHNATSNSLPGAANITTAAGDRATLYYDGTKTYVFAYLRADGTSVVSSGGNQRMLLTASQSTATGQVAYDFTGIPNWAKRVTVMFNGVSGSGTSVIQVQLGANAVETTGYVGYAFRFNGANLGGATGNTSGAPCQTATAGADKINGAMEFILMGSNVWAFKSLFDTNDGIAAQGGVGKKTLSGTLDRIRITTVNGMDTFDAGSVSLLIEGY